MEAKNKVFVAILLCGITAARGFAAYLFDSGSDGRYGPMNITANTTLEMPPDGKFYCTTINVASNVTLRFTPNALNTPVYLLATGNVVIAGTIDVSGASGSAAFGGVGGPGGFSGGNPGASPGDGMGPGAGRAGTNTSSLGFAAYNTVPVGFTGHPNSNDGSRYGSPLLVPLVGGSGGGAMPGVGGYGGGGAVLVASNTRIDISGSVLSSSATYNGLVGFGSGGAIRLISPVVGGAGTLNVSGGQNLAGNYNAGHGRIRIDCVDRRFLALNLMPLSSVASVGANMFVFPSNPPRLDITQVAGTSITVGTNSQVFFMLPDGSSSNQTVTVQARDFGAVMPIRVVLTPDSGTNRVYDTQISNTTVNPASVTVPVTVPVNVQVQVNAWTR